MRFYINRTSVKLKTIKIVRGLKSKEYEVTPEKATFSAPAYSKPLNLLPSTLAPAGGGIAPSVLSPSPLAPAMPTMLAPTMNAPGAAPTAAPTADEGDKTALDGNPGVLSTSEPISLLNSGGGDRIGDDG